MIPKVCFSKSRLTTSKLVLGLSRIHYLRTSKKRQILIAEAADLGFLHFDTAPSYGDGLSEVELGRTISRRRDRFIVATKYGIPASPFIEAHPTIAPSLRVGRSLARRAGVWQDATLPPFTSGGLRTSVERSLKRLNTDYIDILLLHEPNISRIPDAEQLVSELLKLRDDGFIRLFGVAGSWLNICEVMKLEPSLSQIVQTSEQDWTKDIVVPDLTYGSISRGPQSYFSKRILHDAAVERVKAAMKRRKNGSVIVSTTNRNNLQMLAKAAQDRSA